MSANIFTSYWASYHTVSSAEQHADVQLLGCISPQLRVLWISKMSLSC